MGIVQVIIDDSTNKVITGTFVFDRDNGGTFVGGAGAAFPGTPEAGEWFWRTDEAMLYRRNSGNTVWEAISSVSVLSHEALRQLIHFIDNGPANGFASGAYRENTGTVFPTAIIWWESAAKLKKLVEKLMTWTGANPTQVQWKMYAADGVTVLATVTDTITYSGIFETSRTRAIA